MAIKLKWDSVTTPGASILVYRALTPITYDNLPVELTTLAGSTTEYTDSTAAIYTTYYYAIGIKVNTDITLTPIGYVIDMPSNGPGNNTIVRGDAKRGYMGLLTTSEFILPQALIDQLGLVGATANASTTARWLKFVHGNKIKYIYTERIATGAGVSWNNLYNNGAVYGTDTVGTVPSDLTGVIQNKRVQIAGSEFRVRLPRDNFSANFDLLTATDVEAEWSALIRAMYQSGSTNEGVGFETLCDQVMSSVFATTQNTPTAEFNGNYCGGCISSTNTATTSGSTTVKLRTATTNFWRPVLELVI